MKEGKFTIPDIAKALNVSQQTVRRWVGWWEFEGAGLLDFVGTMPPYEVIKGVRLWAASADTIEQFKQFREQATKGAMAEWNAVYSWGKRGQEIAERKVTR